jgi:hypothetical protein
VVHITKYVEGVPTEDLGEHDKEVVKQELREYPERLHQIRRDALGIPGQELMFPPYRVMYHLKKWNCGWKLRENIQGD